MKIWIFNVGEQVPIRNEEIRLRRMGQFAYYASEQGNEVTWFAVSFDHYTKQQMLFGGEAETFWKNQFLQIHMVPVSRYTKNVSFKRIKFHKEAAAGFEKAFLDREDLPDIVVLGSTPLEVGEQISRLCSKYHVPYVIDIRDLWPKIFVETVSGWLKLPVWFYARKKQRKMKKVYKNSAALFGLSRGFLDYGLKIAKRKETELDQIIPMGYPEYPKKFRKKGMDRYWKKMGLSSEDFIIVCSGNFGRQFDYSEVLMAAKYLEKEFPKIKFVLCGDGENLKKIMKKASSNIIFPGWVEKEQMLSLLSSADIGLAPYKNSLNFRMNTPTKFGEYLYFGLPVLVSVDGEMHTLLKKYHCGQYYQNFSDLMIAIRAYYQSPRKKKRSSRKAVKLYDAQFSSEVMNENLILGLQGVLDDQKMNTRMETQSYVR